VRKTGFVGFRVVVVVLGLRAVAGIVDTEDIVAVVGTGDNIDLVGCIGVGVGVDIVKLLPFLFSPPSSFAFQFPFESSGWFAKGPPQKIGSLLSSSYLPSSCESKILFSFSFLCSANHHPRLLFHQTRSYRDQSKALLSKEKKNEKRSQRKNQRKNQRKRQRKN